MDNNKFEWLLKPIRIGHLLLSNRMVRGPIGSKLCWETGEVSQQLIDMYENSAKGGVSLIIVEVTAIDGRHKGVGQLQIDDRKFGPGLHRLVEAIHLNGIPVVIQLCHYGIWGTDPVSPSGVACYGQGRTRYVQPRALSLSEVEEVRDLFIASAVTANNAGLDGILLHGATAYLLEQFVSPHTNKRTDRYGGSLDNRIALPLEIVRGIRQKCGSSFLMGYCLVADELYPDNSGITIEESIAFAKALEQNEVNWIDVTTGTHETFSLDSRTGISNRQGKGMFEFSEAFKKAVSIPIFARCQGQHDPIKWEEAIENGQCDVIQIGRPLLCDPQLPKKVAQGRLGDIRLCIRDNYCFESAVEKRWQLSCALNPELGRERDWAIKRITSIPKKVLIAGGGPGGLEAARVAALRGHKVTLMEKEVMLGGNLRVASFGPGKNCYQTYFGDWLERQCKNAGVEIKLQKAVTAEVVKQLKPDTVIVATGATPLIPPIPGINKKRVVVAADVLTGKTSVGKKVCVAGGGEVGVDTADFIIDNGLAESITIVEMLPEVASDMFATNRSYMLDVILPKAGVNIFTNMHIQEITDEGVVATDKEWNIHKFEADTVILAMGYASDITLYEALRDHVQELYMIGDCVKPRTIADAIREAGYVARQI